MPTNSNVTWICEECLAVNMKPSCADHIYLCDSCKHPILITPYLEEWANSFAGAVAHP